MTRRAVLVLGLLLVTFGVLAAAGVVRREVALQLVDAGVARAETRVDRPYPLWSSLGAIAVGALMVAGSAVLFRRREAASRGARR